jgi:quercetin 2,3-dioxygenase
MNSATAPVTIKRSADRFATNIGWLNSSHSFSFGQHYDRANVGHGLLLVNNDDIVSAGRGFETHPHRDMEIVTWVISGELEHKDSEGNRGLLYPGLAQRMSAGTGIWHSEMNATKNNVHFIQMWVQPDTERINPSYQQLDINDQLASGTLVPIASGKGHDAAISIRQRNAVLWGARLSPGAHISIPDDRYVHIYVPQGGVILDGAVLSHGDAARLTNAGERTLNADVDGAEILIWATS